MSRRFDHNRMSPDEFRAALNAAGISGEEFEALTGVSKAARMQWLLPEDHKRAVEPPFWVTSWLAMFATPGPRQIAEKVARENWIDNSEAAE